MFLNSTDLELNEESAEIVGADDVNETANPDEEQVQVTAVDESSDDESSDDESSDDESSDDVA